LDQLLDVVPVALGLTTQPSRLLIKAGKFISQSLLLSSKLFPLRLQGWQLLLYGRSRRDQFCN